MENPTLVVLTDRNDLDDQLFGTFARCQRSAAPDARAGRETATDLRELLQVASGGVVFTTIQKFLPEEKGDTLPAALRPAQHRRHRRRGPPQPVRLHRRLRPAPARRAAERLVHRLHRHADRADRQEHPGRLRRLHQHLRHPAGGRGRGDRADLLREPAGQAGAERGGAARRSTPSSRRSPRARRSSARRSSRRKWARAGGARRRRERLELVAAGPRRALRAAAGGDGRQGDDRLHEPAHLRRPLRRRSSRSARTGTSDDDEQGRDQGRHDRLGRPTRSAWQPHIRNKAAPRGAGQALQGRRTTRSSS